MSEDIDDIRTEFTSFSCYFDNQEGKLNVAGHVVHFKSTYSEREFEIPIARIRVFKSKKEPKLKLDKKPSEEEGRATERNTESFQLTFTDAEKCEECKELITKYFSRAEKRKKLSSEGNKQAKILAGDPTLKKIYDELVGGGIITKDEFWAERKHLISSTALSSDVAGKGGPIIKEQRKGLKNYMFCSEEQFVSVQKTDSADSNTTIVLNKRKIQQIFTEHPGVYRYYMKVVPTQMNEKEFWAKFLKSYFFRSLDPISSALTNTTTAPPKTEIDHHLEQFEGDMNKEFDEKAKKTSVNPFINIAADDIREGYGIRQDEMTVPSKLIGFPESLKNLNRKSTRITQYSFLTVKPGEGTPSTSDLEEHRDAIDEEKRLLEERERMKEYLEFDDLKSEANVEYIPLKIQDKSRYFEGLLNEQQVSTGNFSKRITNYPLQEMRSAFNKELIELKENLNLQKAIVPADLAVQIYKEISNQIIQSGAHEEKTHNGAYNFQDLENKFGEVFVVVHELLRHLWPLLSLTKSEWKPLHTDRSKKIVEKLNDVQKQLQRLANQQTNQWIKSLTDSIDIALEHYNKRMNPQAIAEQKGGFKTVKPATPQSTPQRSHVSIPLTPQPLSAKVGTPIATPSTPITTPTQSKTPINISIPSTKKPTIGFNLPTPSRTPGSIATPPSISISLKRNATDPMAPTAAPPLDVTPQQKKQKQ